MKKKKTFSEVPKTTLDWSKKFRKQNRLFFIIALFVALYSTYYIYLNIEQARKDGELRTVLVAAEDIPQFTEITDDMLTEMQFRHDQIPEDALVSRDEVVGYISLIDISNEHMLVPQFFIDEVNEESLGLLVEKGLFAFTMGFDWFTAPIPALQPDDVIDIVVSNATEAIGEGGIRRLVPETAVPASDVTVLSIKRDGSFDEQPYIVVLVDKEQANNIMAARALGVHFNVLIHSLKED